MTCSYQFPLINSHFAGMSAEPVNTQIAPPKDPNAPPSYDEAARLPTSPPPAFTPTPIDPASQPQHLAFLPPAPSVTVVTPPAPQRVVVVNNRNQVVAVMDQELIEELRRRRRRRMCISLGIFLFTLILCPIIIIPISID